MDIKTLVIKIGSSSIVEGGAVKKKCLAELVRQIDVLEERGVRVCLITSGAIAVGVSRLGLGEKPAEIERKQACAAIGQTLLMQEYDRVFEIYDRKCAQILLSHADFERKSSAEHLTNTLNSLFSFGVVPVINENDAVSVDEIKVGDNDTLAALVTVLINADALVIISDVKGLYTCDPHNPQAQLVPSVEEITPEIKASAVGHGRLGTGGMATKLHAAEVVTERGKDMYIICNSEIGRLCRILDGSPSGTKFTGKRR